MNYIYIYYILNKEFEEFKATILINVLNVLYAKNRNMKTVENSN